MKQANDVHYEFFSSCKPSSLASHEPLNLYHGSISLCEWPARDKDGCWYLHGQRIDWSWRSPMGIVFGVDVLGTPTPLMWCPYGERELRPGGPPMAYIGASPDKLKLEYFRKE